MGQITNTVTSISSRTIRSNKVASQTSRILLDERPLHSLTRNSNHNLCKGFDGNPIVNELKDIG